VHGGDNTLMFAPMQNPNEWSLYCNELSELKCMIADLKRAYIHEGTLSEHNYMMKVAYDFNPLMYKFIRKWGKDMVPSDLRVAINDIEINRIPVMAPISAPIRGVHFFRGHISLKNGPICPLSSHDSSYFKNMCLLI
jgi:hypothetical protein